MNCADLHLHTDFSDGTSTPRELILEAAKAGLSAISITDHDTVDAVSFSIEFAQGYNIEVIPGVELSTEYQGLEVHILGYLVDHGNQMLQEKLAFLRNSRIERIYKMVEQLRKVGLKLGAQDIFNFSRGSTIGRMHVAQAMVKNGLVASTREAFQKYIGNKRPGYVLGFKLSPAEAIKLIKDTGGIPVLAHPYSLNNDMLIPELVKCGLMGLEVYYPEHSQSMINFYSDLSVKFNLLVTGGSDFHGGVKPEVKMGVMKIPYELVERLKEAKANLSR